MTVGENILFETQQCLHLSIERSPSSNQSEFQKHRTTRARKDQSDSKHQNTAIEYIQNDNITTKNKAKNNLWQSEEQNTNRIEERIRVYQILANKHENKSIKASCSSFVSTCSSLVRIRCDLSKIFWCSSSSSIQETGINPPNKIEWYKWDTNCFVQVSPLRGYFVSRWWRSSVVYT